MGLQMFDARTGTLSPLPDTDKTGLGGIVNQLLAGLIPPPVTPVSANYSLQYISPH
jgi:hypothetical protein